MTSWRPWLGCVGGAGADGSNCEGGPAFAFARNAVLAFKATIHVQSYKHWFSVAVYLWCPALVLGQIEDRVSKKLS